MKGPAYVIESRSDGYALIFRTPIGDSELLVSNSHGDVVEIRLRLLWWFGIPRPNMTDMATVPWDEVRQVTR